MKNLLIVLTLSFILAVSITAFYFSLHKPFTLDEVEEARMAEKINTLGPATFHPGPAGGGEDLSHPLLYSYTNAIFFRLFGSSEPALRSYGIVFFILSAWVLVLFIKEIFRDDKSLFLPAAMTAGALYMINPLLIQHSMLLNADNNISAFAILLYVYLFYKFEDGARHDFIKTRFILAAVVAFNFLCKEITPVFLVLSVAVYRVMSREFKKLLLDILFNLGLGIALFWGIWYIYCALSGTDIMAFIKFTAARKSKKVLRADFFLRQLKYFFVIWKWPFYWASAPFFILLFGAFWRRAVAFFSLKRLSPLDFLAVSSVVMFMPFIFVKPSIDMMKYQYPTIPVFIVLITWFVIKDVLGAEFFRNTELHGKVSALGAFVIGAFSVWYFKVGDYILTLWKSVTLSFIFSYYIPILVICCGAYAVMRRRGAYPAIVTGLLLSIFPVSVGLDINQTRDYTTAECWLNYGERGLRDTVNYLKDRVDPKYVIYCRNDILYYLNFHYGLNMNYYEISPLFRMPRLSAVADILESTPIQYFVLDKVSTVQTANPGIMSLLGKYFYVEKQFGDFIILRSRRY